MDITLERMLSFIPKKPDGKYVHGEKKKFCEKIGAPVNIVSEWEAGKTKSYRNYVYATAASYNVSVEWLRGETDNPAPEAQKEKPPGEGELDNMLIDRLVQLTPEELDKVDAFVQGLIAAREV